MRFKRFKLTRCYENLSFISEFAFIHSNALVNIKIDKEYIYVNTNSYVVFTEDCWYNDIEYEVI